MIVLDASAGVEYLTEAGAVAEWVRTTLEREPEIAAPHLIDAEILSALRKRLLRKELTRPQAQAAVSDFQALALVRYPVTGFVERMWSLRATMTPYDAAYVVLAEALDAPLLTTDARLARSRGHGARVLPIRA